MNIKTKSYIAIGAIGVSLISLAGINFISTYQIDKINEKITAFDKLENEAIRVQLATL